METEINSWSAHDFGMEFHTKVAAPQLYHLALLSLCAHYSAPSWGKRHQARIHHTFLLDKMWHHSFLICQKHVRF
jgi:hypothetical protein